MEKGDFVHINFVGKIKNTGEIFDITKEDIAKKENVYNPKVRYKPIPVIVGGGFVLKGIDEALEKMKVGEKRKIDIPPEKAFGERKEDFVKILPLSFFKMNRIEPVPGRFVTVNNLRGKIISVDGGRVKVDFNNPLAGKELEYEIEIVDSIDDPKDKVKAIVTYFTSLDEIKVKLDEKSVEISPEKNLDQQIKQIIANVIFKWIKGIENVKFVDIFSKSKDIKEENIK